MDSDTHHPFFGFNCLHALLELLMASNYLPDCSFQVPKVSPPHLLFWKSLLHSLHFNCRNIFSYVNNMLHVLLVGRAFIKSL